MQDSTAVQLSDAHFRLLVDSVEDYAIYMLDPQGVVQSWNLGAQRLKGYVPEEIVGQHFSVFYSASDRASGRPAQALTTARMLGRFEDVGWRVRKDGSQFWATVVVTALHDERGTLIGYAKVTRDLTERAYRTFVEATNGIVFTADSQGRPNADSSSWRAFTGQNETEWRGGRGWELIHPEDQVALNVVSERSRAQRSTLTAEFRLRHRSGGYVWMSCRAVPFLSPEGSVREWFGVITDISSRKSAEAAREQALNWWATTLRSIGDAVIATDRRGLVTFMNPVAESLTGWQGADAAGKALAEVFPIFNEETRNPVENPVDTVLRHGLVVGLANHTVLVRRDGSEVPIDDSAAPIKQADGSLDGVVLVFRDASHHKQEMARRTFLAQAGDELMNAADYRQALVHIAELAVPRMADWCAVDIVEPGTTALHRIATAHIDPAKVQYAHRLNEQYPPLENAATGVPNVVRTGRSELYKEIPAELLDKAAVDDEHRRVIRELDLRSAMVVPLRGRDRVFGAISFVYSGNRRYTEDDLAFAEELARRAALIIERRKLEEEARRANGAKDEFLAMLGHELRNPLAPIRTALELMTSRGDVSNAKERAVIERQVNYLVGLVDDLLDVSRITSGKIELELEPIELSAVLARAVETASPLLEQRRHHLEISVPPNGLMVDADPGRLAQVFSNVLINAAKFTNPGGRIAVTAAPEGNDIVIAVKDTGVGIKPDMLPAVFEMFVQEGQSIARSQGGLGLGLSIVRSLVTMHHGSVTVESDGPGQGSTFKVRLPRSDAAVHRTKQPPMLERPGVSRRVLVVDDNVDAASLLEGILTHYGHDIRVAFDGPTALEIASTFKPELALLDIGLPVMDGYELAEKLRALLPDAVPRMIAITGYGQQADRLRAIASGFDRHLVKPVGLELLRKTMAELTPSD